MSMDMEKSAALTERVAFRLPVGRAFLNASANLPTGQTTLTQLLPIIQNLEDAITGRISEEATHAGAPISCRAGCGACCRQMVPISFFEAETLAEWIGTLAAERQAEIEARFHRALLVLRDAGVIEKILDDQWTLKDEVATQLAIDYFHAGVACPFLEEESCSIHPIRPLACREYLVTSPPALCKDPSVNEVAGVQLPLKLSRVLFAFGQKLSQDRRGWVPLVFLMAWRKGGQKPGEFIAGTGKEVLQEFLNQVAEMSHTENGQPA